MPEPRVAFVTGASRGIGKQAAIALAEAGLDVVITGRTIREGEGVDDSGDAARPIPGSLETTARAIEAAGRRALPVRVSTTGGRSATRSSERSTSGDTSTCW